MTSLAAVHSLALFCTLPTFDDGGKGGFTDPISLGPLVDGPVVVLPADIDGDGDADVLIGSVFDARISWIENPGELSFSGKQHILAEGMHDFRALHAEDLDGDGDPDVLAASAAADLVVWYENQDGLGGFGPALVISSASDGATAVYAADLDGDGDADVLSASSLDDTVAWHENTDGLGAFGPRQVISSTVDEASAVFAADLDGDGDQDVASAALAAATIRWHENTDGAGTFGGGMALDATLYGASTVAAEDLDADGDVDVLAGGAFAGVLRWYENGGGGAFAPGQTIADDATDVKAISTADLDGDGNPDVLAALGASPLNHVSWYPNLGLGSFAAGHGISTLYPINEYTLSARAADLDGDGDQDVVSADIIYDTVWWNENEDGQGGFGRAIALANLKAQGPTDLHAADLDGDGDLDLLQTAEGVYPTEESNAVWYENDGTGTLDAVHLVAEDLHDSYGAWAADLDGDGDQDALLSSREDHRVAWLENQDGLGHFGGTQGIAAPSAEPGPVLAQDLDADGDQDVVYGTSNGAGVGVFWLENDGTAQFGPEHTVMSSTGLVTGVEAADLDGDGDPDLLVARGTAAGSWYENDGSGGFGAAQVVTEVSAETLLARDLDADGDLDAVFEEYYLIAWCANDGTGAFGANVVLEQQSNGFTAAGAGDLDGDGDFDVVAAYRDPGAFVKPRWYRNEDGKGAFSEPILLETSSSGFNGVADVVPADVDGDGDQDLFFSDAAADQVRAYESCACPPGAPAAEVVRLGTPRNPLAFLPGVTSGPVVGAIWDPRIDHTSFQPAAVLDLAAVSAGALNVPMSFGTLLVDPSAPSVVVANPSPGAPFAIPVPANCAVVGAALYSQGGSLGSAGDFQLANGLDLTLGWD